MEETHKEGDGKALDKQEKASLEPVNESNSDNFVEEAKKIAKELKEGLEERKKIIEREEKLIARQEALKALGGGSMAGQKENKKEETPQEYSKRIMRGGK